MFAVIDVRNWQRELSNYYLVGRSNAPDPDHREPRPPRPGLSLYAAIASFPRSACPPQEFHYATLMAKPLIRVWTEAEVIRLKQLTDQGATLLRASAALRRSKSSVQKKARELGLRFPGVREVREGLRMSGAIDPVARS